MVRRTVAAAGELGVPVVVLHLTPFEIEEASVQSWCQRFICECLDELTIRAQDSVVRIAFENLFPGPPLDVLRNVLQNAPREVFGFCYDSSHDQIDGPRPAVLIRELADRLLAVHLSDRVAPYRDHKLPGVGFVDFDEVCKELADAGYARPLLLEVETPEARTAELSQFLREAHERADGLARKILEFRRNSPA